MKRARNFLLLLSIIAAPAAAQQRALGIFGLWGAFEGQGRCYAISRPQGARPEEGRRAFAAVGYWPRRGLAGQVHIRLSREKRPGSAVLLRIDGRTFQLAGSGSDAWAADAAADREIVAAMRSALDMTVQTRTARGALVRDQYRLRGAPSAIDAAAIACAPRAALAKAAAAS